MSQASAGAACLRQLGDLEYSEERDQPVFDLFGDLLLPNIPSVDDYELEL